MKKAVLIISAFFAAGWACLFADYNPPGGGEDLDDLVSPLFLAGGPSVVSQESPAADALNPAASALQQRTSIDASYIALADFGDDGWEGHVVNMGASLPTRYGVFSSSFQFLSSSLDDMDLGTMGTLRASFAKDLFPELLVGSGLRFTLGSADSGDFGLAADFGFIHFPQDFFGLEDFRWGGALRNAGKWYSPLDGRSGFPSPFTPVIGAGFTLYRSGDIALGLNGGLAVPAFQNVRLDLGGELTYRQWISINASTRFDLRGTFDDDLARRSMIPSFGITAVFKTDLKTDIKAAADFIRKHEWERSDVKVRAAAGPLHNGIWALGTGLTVNLGVVDTSPPAITVDYEEEIYFSPNLDGAADILEIPFSIRDERYITEYRFIVRDSAGLPVRIIENKEKRPENESFRGIVDRLLAEKKGIDIPDTLRWDGIGDSGARVPDGNYTFVIESRDDNANFAVTELRKFVLDTTPPEIIIQPLVGSGLIFSPNDDGSKDVLVISQEGSVEDLWEASILDAAGLPVRTYAWRNSAPQTITWDGKSDEGLLLPDGVYSYRAASTDRAGNVTEKGFGNIIINTEATPISLLIDASYFSPNGDGILDTITLTPVIPVTFGLESWEIAVTDAEGRVMRRYSGVLNAPLPVVFDGYMEGGTRLPEGPCQARLHVMYRNGNRPRAESPVFYVDLQKPAATAWSDLSLFSPNGDGSKDEIVFYQESSLEEKWTGTIRSADDRAVKTFTWLGRADANFIWNGTGDSGTLVPDGGYTYQLESTDRAGNTGFSNSVAFTINTEETPVILSADLDAFSPNADGVKDVIRFTPVVKVTEGIESYALTVRMAGGEAEIYKVQGRSRLESVFVWDGRGQGGQGAADGNYTADIAVYYQNGNRSFSKTGAFELDTRPPEIQAEAGAAVFSPDGDGFNDVLTFTQVSSSEPLWEGKILNANGIDVKTFFWKGAAENFTWDGADLNGNKAPDGLYSYIISAEDRAGNRTRKVLENILLDTRPVSAFLTAGETGFSPNGDGFRDTMEFTLYLNLLEGLEEWRLEIKDARGGTRKTFTGRAFTSPMKIQWNGLGDDGTVYEDRYTGEFSAVYTKGNRPRAVSGPFLLDITAPEGEVGLSPVPFSPDNDGVDDELTLSLSVRDASPIGEWSLLINDRNGKIFNRFAGKGHPAAEILWDGRSSTGELVLAAEDYPCIFTVSDAVGNTRQVQGKIPVDILVIRDGDRLKIRISNINFAPNSPEVIMDASQTGEKNRSVLKRLVEVLTKYGNYQVLIEGHGNNISGTEREEIQELIPLSIARAGEVRKALIALGLSARRIEAAGKGGREMIFPFSDRDNNWKNRRVEFILVK
jgi:flagellar hook assembly protein FlgD/outer membrane protein OmpA-like peptidoglycan-associated protein